MDFLNHTIGKYKLIRKIGQGGMALVYEGIHEKLATRAAVKILNPVLSVNEHIRLRFENEVKLLAGLDHPNIIRVIDYDETPGRLAIIMEYLTGSDLSTILKTKGRFTTEAVKDIFPQIMSAFHYAHQQGIVHRDIKPSNIFITEKGQVKILDFGIAKIFGTGEDMTSTGAQIGTLIYMSPEQVKGDKSIDHRSDIYSLGVTFFTMLRGNPPYDLSASSHYEISNKIVTQSLPGLNNDTPFSVFIQKAVEKDRNRRFQSVGEMKLKFESDLGSSQSITEVIKTEKNKTKSSFSHSGNTKRFHYYSLFLSFILLAGLAILIYILLGKEPNDDTTLITEEVKQEEPIKTLDNCAFSINLPEAVRVVNLNSYNANGYCDYKVLLSDGYKFMELHSKPKNLVDTISPINTDYANAISTSELDITYKTKSSDFFVISGYDKKGDIVYWRRSFGKKYISDMRLEYNESKRKIIDPLINSLSKSFFSF